MPQSILLQSATIVSNDFNVKNLSKRPSERISDGLFLTLILTLQYSGKEAVGLVFSGVEAQVFSGIQIDL